MTNEEQELLVFIRLMTEDMICEVHGNSIGELRITEGELIAFTPCCPEFGEKVANTIGNTINEFHGNPQFNRKT